jgi:hypothetical protein
MNDDDFVLFLRLSGCVQQSIDRVLPDLERWRRRLLALGFTAVPGPGDGPGSADDERARLHLTLLMLQAASPRNQAIEHPLRDLTRVR